MWKHHIRYIGRFLVSQFNDSSGGVKLKCTHFSSTPPKLYFPKIMIFSHYVEYGVWRENWSHRLQEVKILGLSLPLSFSLPSSICSHQASCNWTRTLNFSNLNRPFNLCKISALSFSFAGPSESWDIWWSDVWPTDRGFLRLTNAHSRFNRSCVTAATTKLCRWFESYSQVWIAIGTLQIWEEIWHRYVSFWQEIWQEVSILNATNMWRDVGDGVLCGESFYTDT